MSFRLGLEAYMCGVFSYIKNMVYLKVLWTLNLHQYSLWIHIARAPTHQHIHHGFFLGQTPAVAVGTNLVIK